MTAFRINSPATTGYGSVSIAMFHIIGQVTLKQYGWLSCASDMIVVINHLQTLTGGVTLTPFYYYIDFSKFISQNII